MNLEQIGMRIKQSRKQAGLTQEKLAELIDVSPHYIYEIEKGTKAMSIYTLAAIADGLHISADYILFGNTSPAPNDDLTNLTDSLSHDTRRNLSDIVSTLLPYLK